jgi:hypothetical protein
MSEEDQKGVRDYLREVLVQLRETNGGLDSIRRELSYQGARLSAIEKRFATLVTTTLIDPLRDRPETERGRPQLTPASTPASAGGGGAGSTAGKPD